MSLATTDDNPGPITRHVSFDGAAEEVESFSDGDVSASNTPGRRSRRPSVSRAALYNPGAANQPPKTDDNADEIPTAVVVVGDVKDADDDEVDSSSDTKSNSVDDSESTAGSTSSSSPSTRNAGVSVIRCGGVKIKIPFTVWTFVAMLVPIALVVTVTSINVSSSVVEVNTVQTFSPLVRRLNDCTAALAAERGSSGPWLTRGAAADRTALDTARAFTNSACLTSYADELRVRASADGGFLADYNLFQQTNVPLLAVWRSQVDARTAVGKTARAFYTDFIDNSSRVVTPVANSLTQSARLFSEIKMLITCYNYIGLGRGVGNALAALAPGTATAAAVATQTEYLAAYGQAQLGRTTLSGLASRHLSDRFAAWEALNTTQLMWSYLALMAANTSAIQAQYSAQWWPVVSAGLAGLAAVQEDHLDYVASGTLAQATANFNLAFLISGVLACVIAAGALAFQQSRVRTELEDQVNKMAKTKNAVSAFVPRFFLRQMGYTAITQVRAGECTKVALAMLFADIRHFTTVSEGMGCEELFDWVQGYFKRMTAIVDTNRGNVNQFIGDALFAVFATAVDSVQCAVAMQCDVQQLNVQRLCEGNGTKTSRSHVPVEIGVGIHHDVVALGILGDAGRHTCTTIASSVNLASRLEGLTKQLGCRIIASDSVMSQLTLSQRGVLRSRSLGGVVVKGSHAVVRIHDVFQSDAREVQQYKAETKEPFEAMMEMFLDGMSPEDARSLMESLTPTVKHFPSEDHGATLPSSSLVMPDAANASEGDMPNAISQLAFNDLPPARAEQHRHTSSVGLPSEPATTFAISPPQTPCRPSNPTRRQFNELRRALTEAEARLKVTDHALREMLARLKPDAKHRGISFHDK